MEEQIIAALEQYAKENPGTKVNEKTRDAIHQNAKAFDNLVSGHEYTMKTQINSDNACVVQFVTEQGAVMSIYTFFNAIIKANAK